MKINKKWLIIAVVIAFPIIVWKVAYPTYSYRFRLAVEIDTPNGMKSGSSVLEVKTVTFPGWVTLGVAESKTETRGEGVFVDLGGGKNAVVTTGLGVLSSSNAMPHIVAAQLANDSAGSTYDPKITYKISQMKGGVIELTEKNVPTILTYLDKSNPQSAQRIYVARPKSNRFTQVLGEGYALRKVTIEIVNAPVTRKIASHLPWLGPNYRYAIIEATPLGQNGQLGTDYFSVPKNVLMKE